MQIQTFNQWLNDSEEFCLFLIMMHNCHYDWGVDLFLFGFGVAIRFNKERML